MNPLAPEKTMHSCCIAAVSAGALDIYGTVVDLSKLSDQLLLSMIDLATEGSYLTNDLLNEKERRGL